MSGESTASRLVAQALESEKRAKKVAVAVVVLASAAVFLGAWGWRIHLKALRDSAVQRESYWHGQVAAIEAQRRAANIREAEAQRVAHEKQREANRLKAEMATIKVPKDPGPPPSEDPAVASDLVAGGLMPGLKITLEPTVLHVDDSRTTWTWMKEAQRVPPLIAYKAACDATVSSLEGVNTALRVENATKDEKVALADAKADAESQRREAAMKGWKAAEKDASYQRRMKWVYGIAGVIIGAEATRRYR